MTVALHLAFLVYLLCGGSLALRWRRSIWVHLATVLWGVAGFTLKVGCPLTELERWARRRAGMPPLASAGFIDHYFTGVIYPPGRVRHAQVATFGTVAMSWIVYVRAQRRHH